MNQLDLFSGPELRDAGIKKALDNAERRSSGWQGDAFEKLRSFLTVKPGAFQTEDFRRWAEDNGLIPPPHARAYGGIIRRAATDGLIKKVGTQAVTNPKAHCAFAAVWIANN